MARLRIMADWPDGWDDLGSPKPDPCAIERAEAWLQGLVDLTRRAAIPWFEPYYVTANGWGEVLVGWRAWDREVALTIRQDSCEYLRGSPGEGLVVGHYETASGLFALYVWLQTGEKDTARAPWTSEKPAAQGVGLPGAVSLGQGPSSGVRSPP